MLYLSQLEVLHNLRILSITESQLYNLPGSIGSLKQLESLDLSSNNLERLPLTFSFCQNLETLDLRSNKFWQFPAQILQLQNLVTFKRKGNGMGRPFQAVEKIVPQSATQPQRQPLSLLECCAQAVFRTKLDYWRSGVIGETQCKMLDDMASNSDFCENCSRLITGRQGTCSTYLTFTPLIAIYTIST